MRTRILQWVGIPCSVGIANTKTLAKLANHIAKAAERKQAIYGAEHAQVCDLSTLAGDEVHTLLGATDVGEVWGVGRRIGAQLIDAGVTTVLELVRLDPATIRGRWSVVVERTVRELQGIPCVDLDDSPAPNKQIACTRSFGRPVLDIEPLIEAVSEFASRAAVKLRRQSSFVSEVMVFVRTSPFRRRPQYSKSTIVPLRRPCDDTSAIVEAAICGLRSIYRSGFQYAKAGVMLMDLQPNSMEQFELDVGEPESGSDRSRLMKAVDAVNDRYGRGSIRVASGRIGQAPRAWVTKQERKSPDYTTSWEQIPPRGLEPRRSRCAPRWA